ncbi:hypothetical protein M378DRAFT_188729 [Amanita muscaria Koide BX008]|uniref:Uncharacterized protein n=1 Tax=Amanita muscaria (strain Koide BX008) TaxID=946122 RepID=A0A0C2VZB9_AMAMK|nr:hypothetical protein M378DRAFT_188772 [Amanita muscaria Koide BX008]KIL54674.1 hypothetical protein M378DRAFT_188729 [Amanita muscaria Koide BX008]
MTAKRRGRKPKVQRNISGLRNQKPQVINPAENLGSFTPAIEESLLGDCVEQEDEDPDIEWDPMVCLDSMRPEWEKEEEEEENLTSGKLSNGTTDLAWFKEGWDSEESSEHGEGRQVKLLNLSISNDDDPRDEDWVPPDLRRKYIKNLKRRRDRPKTYQTGPDISRKAPRTQLRYREANKRQRRLDDKELNWGLEIRRRGHYTSDSDDDLTLLPPPPPAIDRIQIRQESPTPPPLEFEIQIRSESVTPSPLQFEGDNSPQLDPWEEEIHDNLNTQLKEKADIRSWHELRDQIKKDLKKNHYTLSQINQLLIIRNFATLRLKGYGRMEASMTIAEQWHEGTGSQVHFSRRVRALARHYQIYEQLPEEKRGNSRNAYSLLKDESVRNATRGWLTEQEVGSITPQKFVHALNEKILPELGIKPEKALSERTARRWLIKLGWTRTLYKKGIYLDGHERPDVIEYCEEIFLPHLLGYERRMAKYEGPELNRIEPDLEPGEREIIPVWQDETCCQQNDFVSSMWLRTGEHQLRKKGRGRLIHISDFIEPTNGRLVAKNSAGQTVQEARKIIFPGSNGDPYWDGPQLLKQVETQAIPTFEAAHPGCQGLFIFDCSSAHGAMPEDAIKPFEMNKSNGGKQRFQRSTVIPQSNPDPRFRGQVQNMIVDATGEQKGLVDTLKERGFNVTGMKTKCSPVCPYENTGCCMARLLSKQDDIANQMSSLESLIVGAGHLCLFLPKFHCELNPIEMYWGWVKYRYRQVPKPRFDDAKKAAIKALDECPSDVIRKFINRSWRFVSAYRIGLKGKAAAWAVRKYKGHRAISRAALLHIEALAPTN